MILITTFFSILRPYNSVVYAPKLKHADKEHAPPPIGNGLFAWFTPVAKLEEEQVVEKVGLDATLFLRFTRMIRNMFLVMTVFGCGILIPTHILGANTGTLTGYNGSPVAKAFTSMTPQYSKGKPMWSHVVCSWIFDIVIVFFLWRNYKAVTRLRRQYFQSQEYQMSLHSRTIFITHIPSPQRSDEGILWMVDQVDQSSGISRAAIGRNVKELPELMEQYEDAVRKLESILAKYLRNPDKLPAARPTLRPSKNERRVKSDQKVDAIEYLTGRIRDLESQIKDVRESVDQRNPMPYGFATFGRIEEAHTVAFAAKKKHPSKASIKLAPKPNDLIWTNLPLSKSARRRKRFINNIWIAILTVVWVAPNALIAIFLTNLSNLSALWPDFRKSFDGHPLTWAAVQGIAAPALTSLVYLILPILFRRMSIHAGDMTKTSREQHVTHKLYAFFVFNNLVVFSIFSAFWFFVSKIIELRRTEDNVWEAIKEAGLGYQIMVTLCQVSPFWINWLLQRNLGAAADLAQIFNLTWTWFARTFMSPTPRQAIEWTAPPPFDYASYYNYFLFYATVAMCFATLQPLVLLVTAFYFVIDSWLKKYLLLYVFITKTESGGQFWRTLFNRIIFAALLANGVAALVVSTNLGDWTMLGCMVPLPILLLSFKWYCSRSFDDQSEYYIKAGLKDPESHVGHGSKSRGTDRVGLKFGHPALYKPLITPMVHAKAQHVLSQIYGGRLGVDGASTADYSDILMDSMSQSHPGKAARFTPDANASGDHGMFELVPESDLDFAFYKNRTEFADEHGGGGELYGRPIDLVSERSQTPKSFIGHEGDSIPSSRASSPGSVPVRHQNPGNLAYHPIGMGQPGHGDPGSRIFRGGGRDPIYTMSNESERTLLGGAEPVGVSDRGASEVGVETAQYGLDRWRTGRAGYSGVPLVSEDEEPLDYDAYRGRRG